MTSENDTSIISEEVVIIGDQQIEQQQSDNIDITENNNYNTQKDYITQNSNQCFDIQNKSNILQQQMTDQKNGVEIQDDQQQSQNQIISKKLQQQQEQENEYNNKSIHSQDEDEDYGFLDNFQMQFLPIQSLQFPFKNKNQQFIPSLMKQYQQQEQEEENNNNNHTNQIYQFMDNNFSHMNDNNNIHQNKDFQNSSYNIDNFINNNLNNSNSNISNLEQNDQKLQLSCFKKEEFLKNCVVFQESDSSTVYSLQDYQQQQLTIQQQNQLNKIPPIYQLVRKKIEQTHKEDIHKLLKHEHLQRKQHQEQKLKLENEIIKQQYEAQKSEKQKKQEQIMAQQEEKRQEFENLKRLIEQIPKRTRSDSEGSALDCDRLRRQNKLYRYKGLKYKRRNIEQCDQEDLELQFSDENNTNKFGNPKEKHSKKIQKYLKKYGPQSNDNKNEGNISQDQIQQQNDNNQEKRSNLIEQLIEEKKKKLLQDCDDEDIEIMDEDDADGQNNDQQKTNNNYAEDQQYQDYDLCANINRGNQYSLKEQEFQEFCDLAYLSDSHDYNQGYRGALKTLVDVLDNQQQGTLYFEENNVRQTNVKGKQQQQKEKVPQKLKLVQKFNKEEKKFFIENVTTQDKVNFAKIGPDFQCEIPKFQTSVLGHKTASQIQAVRSLQVRTKYKSKKISDELFQKLHQQIKQFFGNHCNQEDTGYILQQVDYDYNKAFKYLQKHAVQLKQYYKKKKEILELTSRKKATRNQKLKLNNE